MRKIIRLLTFCAFVCCCILFCLIGYANIALPDEYNIMSGDEIRLSSPYTVTFNDTSSEGLRVSLETDGTGDRQYDVGIKILNVIPVKTTKVTETKRSYVVPLGTAFGIKLYTQGVVVVKTDGVTAEGGTVNPAAEAGLEAGDIITAVNDRKVERNEDVSKVFAESNGDEITLSVIRKDTAMTLRIRAVKSAADGKYRVGIWVRDSSAGIGTMTFYDSSNGVFAGLGHAVCDIDTGEIMPLSGGEAVDAVIKGSYKGSSGTPGELCGIFKNTVIGKLKLNSDTGIYGMAVKKVSDGKALPVAMNYEITTGAAQILSEVNENGAKYYDAEIVKIYQNTDSHQKNMVIKVTDDELIKETGGIVQGMSGSPIVQNGMIVGAVTHVFINNPLQGYAIFAQTMVETGKSIIESNGMMKQAS